jgi:hypothetical protein
MGLPAAGGNETATQGTYDAIGTLLRQANVGWVRMGFDRRVFDTASNVATQARGRAPRRPCA